MTASPQSAIWFLTTLALYVAAKQLQMRVGRWWAGPAVIVAPLLIAATLATGTDYPTYLQYNIVLVWLLAPATVAFAVPVWTHRTTIRRHAPLLLACVIFASMVSLATGYVFSLAFDLPETIRQSLLPRSMTSPFAMPFAEAIGGDASLAALFVILVGIIGGMLGSTMLRLPIDSPVARGLMFGLSAHGVGTAYARQLGREEGALSALAMILMGLANSLGLALLLLFTG